MPWKPRTFLALLVAGMGCWLERQAAAQIEYLKAENRLLRSKLARRRIVFTDAERRTLAALAREIGTKTLQGLDPVVSPATLFRWHREFIARKWTFLERRRPGRPRTKVDNEQLIVQMAQENPSWGYTRIHGALLNLGIKIGRGTIRRILKDHLIEPTPARGRRVPWSVFLKAHWKAIAATDFFTVEVWSWRGLVTHYILFVIDLATRRVVIGGITTNPNEAWMLQVARNLTDGESGMLRGKRHLIVDRDTKYSSAFRAFLAREGVEVIRLPPRSPNLNAFAERFVRSVKSECLSKLIPIGAPMLRHAVHEYMQHYHLERNHQGLGNQLIVPLRVPQSKYERIDRRTRLGGMLSFYEPAAA
jgi:transposase InsO family protein